MATYAKIRERDEKGRFVKPTVASGFDKKQYKKEYYLKHKDSIKKRVLEWGRLNKEKRKIAKDKWRAKNKERTNFLTKRYQYKRKNAEGSITWQEWKAIVSGQTCAYCNKFPATSVDHVVPLSRGGTNNKDNLLPVCISCNSKKGSKTLFEYDRMLFIQFDYLSRKHA